MRRAAHGSRGRREPSGHDARPKPHHRHRHHPFAFALVVVLALASCCAPLSTPGPGGVTPSTAGAPAPTSTAAAGVRLRASNATHVFFEATPPGAVLTRFSRSPSPAMVAASLQAQFPLPPQQAAQGFPFAADGSVLLCRRPQPVVRSACIHPAADYQFAGEGAGPARAPLVVQVQGPATQQLPWSPLGLRVSFEGSVRWACAQPGECASFEVQFFLRQNGSRALLEIGLPLDSSPATALSTVTLPTGDETAVEVPRAILPPYSLIEVVVFSFSPLGLYDLAIATIETPAAPLTDLQPHLELAVSATDGTLLQALLERSLLLPDRVVAVQFEVTQAFVGSPLGAFSLVRPNPAQLLSRLLPLPTAAFPEGWVFDAPLSVEVNSDVTVRGRWLGDLTGSVSAWSEPQRLRTGPGLQDAPLAQQTAMAFEGQIQLRVRIERELGTATLSFEVSLLTETLSVHDVVSCPVPCVRILLPIDLVPDPVQFVSVAVRNNLGVGQPSAPLRLTVPASAGSSSSSQDARVRILIGTLLPVVVLAVLAMAGLCFYTHRLRRRQDNRFGIHPDSWELNRRDFESIGPIGAGAQGQVVKVKRLRDGRIFAFKEAHPSFFRHGSGASGSGAGSGNRARGGLFTFPRSRSSDRGNGHRTGGDGDSNRTSTNGAGANTNGEGPGWGGVWRAGPAASSPSSPSPPSSALPSAGAVLAEGAASGSGPSVGLDCFLAEMRFLKMVQEDPPHENIIQLVGVITQTLPMAICLEFMENGDLKSFLSNNARLGLRTPLDVKFRMAQDICRAMCHLQKFNFIHRDLSARNCLVSADERVKLADFGMMRGLGRQDYYRPWGTEVVLPVRWSAPETLRTGCHFVRSDVYALGVTLWEIYADGRVPYDDLSQAEVLAAVKEGRRLAKPAADCNPRIWEIMRLCWQERPGDRPHFTEIAQAMGCLPLPQRRLHNPGRPTANANGNPAHARRGGGGGGGHPLRHGSFGLTSDLHRRTSAPSLAGGGDGGGGDGGDGRHPSVVVPTIALPRSMSDNTAQGTSPLLLLPPVSSQQTEV